MTALVDAMGVEAQRASWLLIAAGGTAAVTMLMLAASWRRETRRQVAERDQQISSLQRQRDALVREIHHRIKNHLQGLLGLFEGYRSTHDKATVEQSLATLHGHVLALVGIHGLQSRQLDETISLPKLAHQQVELIRAGFVGARLDISEQTSPEPLLLSADQAVPIALVITELIVNAIKHGAEGPISIAIGTGENGACVAVTNRIARPPGLQWGTQSGLGTGLGLVNTLIQGIGRLEQTTTLDQLTMALHLVTVSPAPPSSVECHAS